MKTLLIKTKSGRVVEVNESHGRFLLEKEGASIVLPETKEEETKKETKK